MTELKKKKKRVILDRDELGRIRPKKANPGRPGRPSKKDRKPYTIQIANTNGELLKNTPLYKDISRIEKYIDNKPLDAAEQIINKDLAVLTAITDGILQAALQDGDIFSGGKVNPLLNQSNYLAFQAARRMTLNSLLQVERLKALKEKKKRPPGRPPVKTDIEILMQR